MQISGSSCNRRIGVSRVREEIALLYPPAERERELALFEKSKRSMVSKIVLLGVLVTVAVWAASYGSGVLEHDMLIRKNAYGLGSKQAELIAVTKHAGEEIMEEITVEIPEKQYTKEETEELFTKMLPELDKAVLAENKSLDTVENDLYFAKTLPGYPFEITWETDACDVIDTGGNVNTEQVEKEGKLVQIKADIVYGEFEKEYIFHARAVPKEKTAAEVQEEKLKHALELAKEDTQYEDYFVLPETVDTEPIVWKEKKENNSTVFLLLFAAAAVAVCIGKNRELHQRTVKRNQQLLSDYPEIVSKIVLLIGAGMTVRGAFFKIAADYRKKREAGSMCRYAYEEIVYTCNEMDTGVAEAQAYVNWGRRCLAKQYMKLSLLLVQNLKKGSAGLMQSLQEEVKQAFEEKKAGAKRAGEEAGTKLLLPMGLMLLVVMVVIIVPAFSSFG